MTPPAKIYRLIETFNNNIDYYKSSSYNEAQLRQEFLDPLFTSLGWDMDNRAGLAPQYRDVIHEASIKIGGATKAPDYAFSIHGQYKFFLEAKKPAVNIRDDSEPAYQLRRYGWSAKLPVSVLTDFEEFAVYDCRRPPKRGERASTSRIFYIKYSDFIEKWDELYGTFSKDAILKGSFDKYVVQTKRHKGVETVDDAFLDEIEEWRLLLARNFALRNSLLSVRDLNYVVQKTIDRIIFLRICEDRGIEEYQKLNSLTDNKGIYSKLLDLFRIADARYNSGLFHFSKETGRDAHDSISASLNLDDSVLRKIIPKLYYPDSPYEFSVLPADILGQVYEQFLGKSIVLTKNHQAKVEQKPEVRKAGGVYYTPSYIVDYIVQNTIGIQLNGAEKDSPNPIAISKAENIKIMDPACGSGSFLIVAYQYLLDWHLRQYTIEHNSDELSPGKIKRHSSGKTPKIYQSSGGGWTLTTNERKRILLNNIFGVDIDSQAVEVTKLSLLLKVIEGESEQIKQHDWIQQRERILPDLGNNIKCGNTLIGPDFYDNQQKLLLDEVSQYRVNVFNWDEEFREVMSNGGFDCVIGNPPYIRIQRIEKEESDYLFDRYKFSTSKADLSILFLEKALAISKPRSTNGFISTSQWLASDYGVGVREELGKGLLHRFVDFGSLPVFKNVSTYPAIMIFSNSPKSDLEYLQIRTREKLNIRGIETCATSFRSFKNLESTPWILRGFSVKKLIDRNMGLGICPLSTFGKSYIGCKTGLNEAFVLSGDECSGIEQELLLPYAMRGGEVKRYEEVIPHNHVIYPYLPDNDGKSVLIEPKVFRSKYPKAYKHLLQFRDRLRERKDSRKLYATGDDWYRHLRSGQFTHVWPKKLVIKGISQTSVVGILSEHTIFDGARCPSIILAENNDYSPEYFLGILNSKMATAHFLSVCPAKMNNYLEFPARVITNFPVRPINFNNKDARKMHDVMVTLVTTMLKIKSSLASELNPISRNSLTAQEQVVDRQIDRLVYDLYEVNVDEIELIEESVGTV